MYYSFYHLLLQFRIGLMMIVKMEIKSVFEKKKNPTLKLFAFRLLF